jgi:hypothetical protein
MLFQTQWSHLKFFIQEHLSKNAYYAKILNSWIFLYGSLDKINNIIFLNILSSFKKSPVAKMWYVYIVPFSDNEE